MSTYGPDSNRQSSSSAIWIIIVALVVGLPILAVAVAILGCCGMMGIGAYSAFTIPAEMVKQQYANDPLVVQHIGQIQSVSLNITASGEEGEKLAQNPNAPEHSVMVFDVRGTKGSGQIIAEQQPGDPSGKMFSKATLRTVQGEFPLSQ